MDEMVEGSTCHGRRRRPLLIDMCFPFPSCIPAMVTCSTVGEICVGSEQERIILSWASKGVFLLRPLEYKYVESAVVETDHSLYEKP